MRFVVPLLLALTLATGSYAARDSRPRAALAWVNGGSLGIQDAAGRRTAIALPDAPNATVDALTWLSDGRRIAFLRGTVLNVADVRTRRVQTLAPPGRGGIQVAFGRDGRIAIARGPAACGSADPEELRVYVVDASGDLRSVPTFPSSSPPEQGTFFWFTHFAWSSGGHLAYVLHERRASCRATTMRSTLVVTRAGVGEHPRALVSFRPWNSFAASTRWRPDGRRIAYASSRNKLVGVGDVAVNGSGLRAASLRRYANTVSVDWVGTRPVLLVNDDADVDTYRVDLARRKLDLLLKARFWGGDQPQGLVAASRDGRYLSFVTYGGLSVVDMQTRRRWTPRADFAGASRDGRSLAIERGPLVRLPVRRGQIEIVDVRTHRRQRIPTPRRYEEIAVLLR
jgi:Tol biopolymer transport system component